MVPTSWTTNLKNTTNHSLGLGSRWRAGCSGTSSNGGYEQEEFNVNADFSWAHGSDNWNVAFGAEYREETYTINRG